MTTPIGPSTKRAWPFAHLPLLDPKIESAEWKSLLESGKVFDHNERNEFIALLPFPGKNQTLVLYYDHYSIATSPTLQTLTEFCRAMLLVEPRQIQATIRNVFSFSHYKTPALNRRFAMIPLEKAEHGIWLNPAAIYQTEIQQQKTIVTMTNGAQIVSPVQKQSLETAATNGLVLLACFRRDFDQDWSGSPQSPLEFLQLDYTPFTSKLSRRKVLHTWHCPKGAIFKAFSELRNKLAITDYCRSNGYDFED